MDFLRSEQEGEYKWCKQWESEAGEKEEGKGKWEEQKQEQENEREEEENEREQEENEREKEEKKKIMRTTALGGLGVGKAKRL